MNKLTKSLQWFDKHILKILVIGFIFIIPLYPKLPLFGVNYTYVAIRLEDLYLGIITGVFILQLLRKKVSISKKFAILFGLYWLVVFVSFLWGWYVAETIEIQTLGFLHSARRIEYMIIFFIAASTIKSKKDFQLYLNLVYTTLVLVCIYGLGQKFLGWPAVQTMNPEFAKGYLLVLDSWARISSTFAGHYDLAAYLVFLIPIIIGSYESTSKKRYIALFLLTLSTLVLTASRASYGAYLIAIVLYLLYIRKFKMLVFVLIATAILTPLSDNLTNRITRTFQQTKIFVDPETGEVIVPKNMNPDELPPGTFGTTEEELIKQKLQKAEKVIVDEKTIRETKAQIREDIVKEAEKTGATLTAEEIEAMVNETFGKQIPISQYLIDISLSTRFQVEWPRAINAFRSNILLGTGPSSLGEATDGDYFRWLGETGLLGFLLFLGIICSILGFVWMRIKLLSKKTAYIYYGFIFGTLGLLVNASYIDVFEASKVAYTFWLVSGIFVASLYVQTKNKIKTDDLKI